MSDSNHEHDALASADASFFAPPVVPEPARKRAPSKTAAQRKTEEVANSAVEAAAVKGDPMHELICITLHDTKEIPPNGQFVGVNGKQFIIKPGVKCKVPRYVVEALNNAIVGIPDINDQLQVVGVRDAPRLPYTIHLGE
jgi:hypothetical protein